MMPHRISAVSTLLCVALGVSAYPSDCTAETKPAARTKFVLSSPDKQLAAKVPEVYTASVFGCIGGNMSPPLEWSGEPSGTKSYVVTLFDPDEHGDPSGWWHWIVYNLPANTHSLPKGAGDNITFRDFTVCNWPPHTLWTMWMRALGVTPI